MKYYKLYITITGRRKDKKLLETNISKKELEKQMWFWKNGYYSHSKLFITECHEVEVAST